MRTHKELTGALCARDYKDPQVVFDDVVLNDQGGAVMSVNKVVGMIRSQMKHHEPIVFPQRQYAKYRESEIGSSIRAKGGMYGGGSENIACVYDCNAKDARYNRRENNTPTLNAMMGTGGNNVPLTISGISITNLGKNGSAINQKGNAFSLTQEDHHVMENRVARRLTPTECERLQGLPDGYTAYGADSKRYKALGNGMAQPCADYVMEQVVNAIRNEVTAPSCEGKDSDSTLLN